MVIDYDYLVSEYAKCYQDKSRVYMIQSFLKTLDNTQHKKVPFTLFPRQQELCKTLGGGLDGSASSIVAEKSRQAGVTSTVSAFIACEMCLADKASPQTVLAIGNTLDISQQVLNKVRDYLLQFPLWLWGDEYMDLGVNPMLPPKNKNLIFDVCNSKELVLKNGCHVVARSSGPDASRGVGGVQWLIFDEAAFIENGKRVYTSALPTVSTGGHIIVCSTPNGKDPFYYEICRRARLKGTSEWNGFHLCSFRWYQDPRYNRGLQWVKRDETTNELIVKDEVYIDVEQNIAYDEAHWEEMIADGWKPRSPWYEKMCKLANYDKILIAQELDVSFLGSADNVVEPEYIKMQEELNVRDPLYTDNIIKETWIWKPALPGHTYIMGVDNSRGDAEDSTALEIYDLDGVGDDGMPCIEQVLEYCGKIRGDDMGELAFRYGCMYNNAYAVVDCIGGTGDACVLMMERLDYKNLYYDDPNLKKYMTMQDASSVPVDKEGRLPGFHSSSVRFQMLSNFADMVKTNQIKIRSKRIIAELDTWIYKGGRMDHQDGHHDDTITCSAMAMFIARFSMKHQLEAKAKTKAILNAWVSSNNIKNNLVPYIKNGANDGTDNSYKNKPKPFYKSQATVSSMNPYRWLLR